MFTQIKAQPKLTSNLNRSKSTLHSDTDVVAAGVAPAAAAAIVATNMTKVAMFPGRFIQTARKISNDRKSRG